MARNCFNLLCCYGLRAQLPIKPIQNFSLYKRHGFLPLHSLLLRHSVNQTQQSFKSTYQTDNVKSEDVGQSDTVKRSETMERLAKEGFKQIYRVNNAHLFAAVNKFKWHQTFLTLVGLPLSVMGVSMGILDAQAPAAVLFIGGSVSIFFWTLGIFVTRVIGIVSVSPDSKTVCLSYINNKGRRQDAIFPTEDIIPVDQQPIAKYTRHWWVSVNRYSSVKEGRRPYRLLLQMCEIKDPKLFTEIFGSI